MRWKGVVLALLMLAPLLPVAPAAGEVPTARWLGPTGMLEGWHVRIPVKVENTLHREIVDAVVSHDLRLADALIDAGWAVSRKGNTVLVESWELDLDSIRVVEYRGVLGGNPLDGAFVGEVPSRSSPGLHDATRGFNNRTQPDVHVEWVMPGVTLRNATRTFMIYVDTLTNGRKDAPAYSEQAMAPLDGRGWISRGTTLYGTAGRLILLALEHDTVARVDVYADGTTKPAPISAGADGAGANPALLKKGVPQSYSLGQNGVPVRIESNKPLLALGFDGGKSGVNIGGPIPSSNGGITGTEFLVPSTLTLGVIAVSVGEAATVRTTVGTYSVSPGIPVAAIPFVDANRMTYVDLVNVTSTAPIMLLSWPTVRAQFPSTYGAPTGSRLVGVPFTGYFCGPNSEQSMGNPIDCTPAPKPPCIADNLQYRLDPSSQVVVTAYERPTSVRGRDVFSGAIEFPMDFGKPAPTGYNITPGTQRNAPVELETLNSRRSGGADCPMLLHTTTDEFSEAFANTGRIAAWGGAGGGVGTPIGNGGATSFWTFWDVNVIAHHNGTLVEVRQEGKPSVTKSLGKGDLYRGISGALNAPSQIISNKPIVVLPKTAGGFFAAFDESLKAVPLGKPQYRGYLVSLEPATASTEPMQGIAAPGKGATYKLLVKNLAKDDQGRGVADVIDLSFDTPELGWTAELSHTTLRIEGGGSREVTLQITPPPDVKEGDKTRLNVKATSQGNPGMSDRIQTITTVRASYEVGIWYDREGAPPGKTLTLDPNETRDVKVVVKNLASVPDRIFVRATPTSTGWGVRFAEAPGALIDVNLDAGESRTLILRLTAPEAKAAQTNLEVRATSASDASASAKQDATARVRADIRIALLVNETTFEAPPGGEARIRIVFENRGSDRVGIKFNTTGALPDGWARPVTRSGEYEIDELTGIAPGDRVPLDLYVRVPPDAQKGERVSLHFFVETLPQFLGDPVLREGVDLVVLAGARHALTPVDPAGAVSLGFQEEVRAQLSLANAGNGLETLRVVPVQLPPGVSVLVGEPAQVAVGARGAVEMTVTFPPATLAGTYPVKANVVADDGHVVPWEFNVTVPERRVAEMVPLGPLRGTAGVREQVQMEIMNKGNVPLRTPPTLLLPAGWTHEWHGEAGFVAPGASALATLVLQAPRDAAPGFYDLEPDPTWALGERLQWDLRTVVLQAEASFGEGAVAVKLHNAGTGEALQVEVTLLQGSVQVDRAVIQRLPASGNASAILAPRAGVSGELVVVVDNSSRYADQPLALQVTGAQELSPTPGPGVALILAALGVALLARRRPKR